MHDNRKNKPKVSLELVFVGVLLLLSVIVDDGVVSACIKK